MKIRNRKKHNKSAGFTLIELVISIGILSILATFLIATLNPLQQFEKAHDGQRKSDLSQIKRALEQYYQDHASYPANDGSYQIKDFNGSSVSWGGNAGWQPYMNLVPKDPSSDRQYVYRSTNNGQTYQLYTALERGPEDPQTCESQSALCKANPDNVSDCNCPNVPSGVDCGTGGAHHPCNFGVTSPNTTP